MDISVGIEDVDMNLVDIIYFEETEFVTSYVRSIQQLHVSLRASHLYHEFSNVPSFVMCEYRQFPSSLPMSECTSNIPAN